MQPLKLFQRFSRRFNKPLKLLSFLGFVSFSVWVVYNLFSIKTIEIEGGKREKLLGPVLLYGKNLLWLKKEEVAKTLLRNNPYLKEVEVYKKYPNKLVIKTSWRDPVGFLQVKEGYFLLDKEGRILKRIRENTNDFPLLVFYQIFSFEDYSVGEYLDYIELKYSLEIIDLLSRLGFPVNKVDILQRNMIRFKLNKNQLEINTIYISAERDLKEQQWEVKEILKFLEVSGKRASEIDLRFKRPILR